MPKEVKLTRGLVSLVDDEDYDRVMQFCWQGYPHCKTFYAQRSMQLGNGKQKTVQLHRFILKLEAKTPIVDHRDGNGLNNQKSNLRLCSLAENARHLIRPPKNNTGYRGVYFDRNKERYIVQAHDRFGKKMWVGTFKDLIEAALAFDRHAREHYGEFCGRLNFPDALPKPGSSE